MAYTYEIERYSVRKALEGKDVYRERKGKPVDAERALYLSTVRIMPEKPLCIVQILHGIDEHKERYLPFATYLASRGMGVVLHDLRGHGRSLLPEGLGYCGEEAVALLHTDIDSVYASAFLPIPESGTMEITPADMPAVDPIPRYLLGFSMGALLAGSYAGRYDERLAGVIFAGLPHREPLVSLALGWIRLLSVTNGENGRPTLLNKYSFRRYNRPFRRAGESGSFLWLSEDLENIDRFRADPACGAPMTISLYRFLLTMERDMYTPASWEMLRRDLPIWLFSGEKDPVAGGEKWVLDSETFLADMGYTHIENRLFPQCRHEIFFDKTRNGVWQEVADCMLETVPDEQARLDEIRAKEEATYTSMFEK